MRGDDHDLERFVSAQAGGVWQRAMAELTGGRKTGHWMWFIFPQVDGLGSSPTARFYAIASLAEARAYLAHPVLGPRLIEGAELVAASTTASAVALLGSIDAQKLHSSMTLFLRADPAHPAFSRVIDRYFDGRVDAATDRILGQE